jgi:hypothetical protein
MDSNLFYQPYLQIQHHMDLIPPAADILRNDGRETVAAFLGEAGDDGKRYIDIIRDGARAADVPFSGGYVLRQPYFHRFTAGFIALFFRKTGMDG